MLMRVRNIEKVYAFDIDPTQAQRFAKELTQELSLSIDPVTDLRTAVYRSDICITCTTSKEPLLHLVDIAPGTFIAAVGADNEDKQELESSILSSSKLVTDLTAQCATIGELHHAISQGLMTKEKVYAELGEIISGKKEGRTSTDEVIVFDSTGTALQDVAAAAIVYEKGIALGRGVKLNFTE
jgi:alanine dehydrogenase